MINFLKIWDIAKRICSEETGARIKDVAAKAGMILQGGEEVFFLAVQLLDQIKVLEAQKSSDFKTRAFSPDLDRLVARGVQDYVDLEED